MPPIDDRTTNRNYAKPNALNNLSDDVTRLRSALDAIDTDIDTLDFAPAAQGVTNGNSHDHNGGDGAQIAYTSLSGLPTLGSLAGLSALGNITSAGAIGSTTNLPLITTTAGAVTIGSFGTTANTFCEGNDSRLSDARTPTAHNQAWSTITSTPTTLSGYGITDAAANGAITGSGLTLATARLVGRTTASTGAPEEISVGASLSLSAGVLNLGATPALGTPVSGTLTNCTGLPVAGITASTSAALGVGTIELGAVADTTISRASAGVVAVEGVALARVIASGTAVMGTGAIASAASATVVTVAATGALTTDVIDWGFNANPNAVTGYSAASTTGCLVITAYPTAGDVNFLVSNPTAASITPGSLTLNWKVTR